MAYHYGKKRQRQDQINQEAQAAYESEMAVWGAVMGGVNLLYQGAGWLEGGLIASPEKFIMDCEVLQMIHDQVVRARKWVDDVEWSAEDATRTEMDYLIKCVDTAIKAGATTINLPDTVGYATPDELREFFEQIYSPNSLIVDREGGVDARAGAGQEAAQLIVHLHLAPGDPT